MTVVPFTGITTVDEPANQILEKAKDWDLDRCLVVGTDQEGKLVFGGNESDLGTMLLILERAKHYLMTEMDDA